MPIAASPGRPPRRDENTEQPERGQIIFLNGATSAGKTRIADELLPLLEIPYFHLQVDAFNAMRARVPTLELDPDRLNVVLERTVLGFHRAVAGMAAAGNPVMVDHVLREQSWLDDCLDQLAGFDVVFVGVHCSLPELERRERARSDRQRGRAAYHFPRVHSHGTYDVEVDTSATGPRDCAVTIHEYLARPATSRAFDRLRDARPA